MICRAVMVAALGLGTAAAAQDLVYSNVATEACLDTAGDPSGCIGQSAQVCMDQTPGGRATAAMSGCLSRELGYWDDRLNAAYSVVLNAQKQAEAEARTYGYSEPPRVEPLRAMQRAWITFRDAKCDFERTQWGGGTGGGPATMSCLMQTTADQALFLETMVRDN